MAKHPIEEFGTNVVKAAVFESPTDRQSISVSKQLEPYWDEDYYAGKAVQPPHNIEATLACFMGSPRLAKLIRVFTRNTVGLGWYFEPKNVLGTDDQVPESADVKAEDAILTAFFDNINPDMPFTEVAERVSIDRETTGNGYYEVTRNIGRTISGVYHIPSENMRVIPAGNRIGGYVQVDTFNGSGGMPRKVYFKRFGDPRIINKETGAEDASCPEALRATEIIHRTVYTPGSYWYGQPRWLPAVPSININVHAQAWNLNFVVNNASWPLAIITENAELGPESQKELKDLIEKKGKGLNAAGKVILLQAQKKGASQRSVDSRIRIEKLAMGTQDDGSFLKLIAKNDDYVREMFGIAELFLGTAGDLNRASASVSRQVTNEQEFAPVAVTEEDIIQRTIVTDYAASLGIKSLSNVFRFRRPRMTDHLQESQILARLGVEDVLDVEEIRNFLMKVVPALNLKARLDDRKNLTPTELQQEASATNTAIAATSREPGVPESIFNETRVRRSVQDLVDAIREVFDR